MKCLFCGNYYILPIDLKAVGGDLRITKKKIQINEVNVQNFPKKISIKDDSFKCDKCKKDLDISTEIITTCTECYDTYQLKDMGFVESKLSPICKNCAEHGFDDETFTPLLENLENMEIQC